MSTRTLFTLAIVALLGLSIAAPSFAGPNVVTVVSAREASSAISMAKASGNETVTITPKDFCAVSAEMSNEFCIQPLTMNLRNGWTRASFDLPQTGKLSVVLYDRLGREVTEIQNGELAAGRHTFNFREHRLPIDTFYLTVSWTQDGETVTQKMFL